MPFLEGFTSLSHFFLGEIMSQPGKIILLGRICHVTLMFMCVYLVVWMKARFIYATDSKCT